MHIFFFTQDILMFECLEIYQPQSARAFGQIVKVILPPHEYQDTVFIHFSCQWF